jgi:SAM-dependent methyltransferase
VIWERRVTVSTHDRLRQAYNARHERGFLRDRDRFYRAMARRMAPAPGSRILDSGCGGGYLLRELAACDTFGVDISDVALAEASRVAPRAHLVLAAGELLPFPDDAFDHAACLGNLEHFLDPAAGVRELVRVTRRGGGVWLLLPNSYYSGDIWRVVRFGYGPDHHQPVERFGTINEWRDLLEANGLEVLEVRPYNRFKWWKRLLPRNLAYHFLYHCRPATP